MTIWPVVANNEGDGEMKMWNSKEDFTFDYDANEQKFHDLEDRMESMSSQSAIVIFVVAVVVLILLLAR